MSPKAPKTSSASTADKRPSATVLVNFLNAYFQNYRIDTEFDGQKVRFRTLTAKQEDQLASKDKDVKKRAPKAIIDLKTFTALQRYCTECAKCQKEAEKVAKAKAKEEGKKDSDKTKVKLSKETLAKLTADTFDARLRGLLEIAAKAVIKPPKPEGETKRAKKDPNAPEEPPAPRAKPLPKENAFEKHVLPGLNLGTAKEQTIESFVDAINAFYNDRDRLRTRSYNNNFPHALHKPDAPAEGVNVIYLQHVSTYHDDILKSFVEAELSDKEILELIKTQFIEQFKPDDKLSAEEKDALSLNLKHQPTVDNVLTPPENPKWINELKAFKAKGKGVVQTSTPLTKAERDAIVRLVRELNGAVSFLKTIKRAHEFKPDADLKECYENYNMLLDEIRDFHVAHKPKTRTHLTFIKFLVESAVFFKGKFNYKEPLKNFLTDLKAKVPIKFDKKTRKALNDFISGERQMTDEALAEVADEFKAEWTLINSPKSYDVNKLDVYSKLGKFVPASIGKQHKVAVGIAIFQFLLEQTRLQRSLNAKKKEVVIYIRA